jgi:hypothetical protein
VMTGAAAWNNLPVQSVYLGSFVLILVFEGSFLAGFRILKFGDAYVLLMNGSCAWWVSSSSLFNHLELW